MERLAGSTTYTAGAARRWSGFAACAWATIFAFVHVYWLVGGRIGIPAQVSLRDNIPLLAIDTVAVPLCAAAAYLGFALAHRPGARLSRRLLLFGAALTSAVLLVHSIPSMVELMVLAVREPSDDIEGLKKLSLYLYEPWFFAGGVVFGVAAWCYWRDEDLHPR